VELRFTWRITRCLRAWDEDKLCEMGSTPEITRILVAWGNGDSDALRQLTPLVLRELHRLAKRHMALESPGHVLQTSALVNEAYLRLIDVNAVKWQNRAHFFALSSRLMRRILVDFARSNRSLKNGGHALQVTLNDAIVAAPQPVADVVSLDEALQRLEAVDPRQSAVVELRYFGGLSLEESAEALKVSVATVRRDWTLARAWLHRELANESPDRA
jgi:RNA polymerase sigma factor (TIGR02999 family)